MTDEEYARKWQEEEYARKTFADGTVEIFSERGERVRSKSEKLIADKLLMMKIPYHYEKPLVLYNGKTVHPDFTMLNVRMRKVIYIEHLGMLDDGKYSEANLIYRLDDYEKSGIYLGDQLFFTRESRNRPLDMRSVEQLLIRILL